MQINLLPPKLIHKLKQIQRNFLWGSTDQKYKLHLINWDKISTPKSEDDLGIQKLSQKNKALLTNFLWCYIHFNNSPWANILSAKYDHPQEYFKNILYNQK